MTVSQPNFAHGTNTEQVATDTGGQRPHGSMPPLANKVENIDHGQVSMGCIQVSLPWGSEARHGSLSPRVNTTK